MNHYAKWFGRIVILGVVTNLALAIPALIAPGPILALFKLPPAMSDIWVRFAANLLILLSIFYISPGLNPLEHRSSAWLCVIARLAGFAFFISQPRDYLIFGLYDLCFAIPQGIVLFLALRMAPNPPNHTLPERGT